MVVTQVVNKLEGAKSIEPGVHLPVELTCVGTLPECMLQRLCRAQLLESANEALCITLKTKWRRYRWNVPAKKPASCQANPAAGRKRPDDKAETP